MLCPQCQQTRSADSSPCPRCGMSSPLQAYWGPNQRDSRTMTWQGTNTSTTASYEQIQQLPFEEQLSPFLPATLPAHYGNLERQNSRTLHLVSSEVIEQILPNIDEQATYIPPIYQRNHSLPSRKRVLSGLISIILVAFLLCIWAGYHLTVVNQQFTALSRWISGAPPTSLQQTQALQTIHDPKREPDRGPAAPIIGSATTAARLDPQTHIAVSTEQLFQPNEPVYLTYTIKPTQKGTVTIKWYTNKLMYAPSNLSVDPKDGSIANGYSEMRFVQPTEGYVELYWNNMLAQRLYFAVRTKQ